MDAPEISYKYSGDDSSESSTRQIKNDPVKVLPKPETYSGYLLQKFKENPRLYVFCGIMAIGLLARLLN